MKRSMFLQNSQYPGQFPDRIRGIAGVCFVPLLAWTLCGQELPADRVSVPLRDPSRPGLVKANLMAGGITVKGYDGKEVIVEARLRHGHSGDGDKLDKNAGGLKRIDVATTGLTVEEEDNVVSVSTGPSHRAVDLFIQVPFKTSFKVGCLNDGDIVAEKVEGEIEANNLNGSICIRKGKP